MLLVDTPHEGLRSRKKRKTRLAIKEAAIDLFGERGYDATTVEAIAARAEVSVTTFFRYFASKEEVVFPEDTERLPAVRRIIMEQPIATCDLDAVRIALQEALDVSEDPDRLARLTRAMMSSYALLGRGTELIFGYQDTIGEALAERRGLSEPDDLCRLTAAVSMTALAHAWMSWERNRSGDLEGLIDKSFHLLGAIVGSERGVLSR
jgi:AcrR family transcriptional regulator